MVIHNMREKRPEYNLISNNCQNFAEALLDKVQIGAHRDFATAFAVYQRATGKGEIKDLFDEHPEEHPDEQPGAQADQQTPPEAEGRNTVQYAQHLMDKHTPKVDFHSESILKAFHRG